MSWHGNDVFAGHLAARGLWWLLAALIALAVAWAAPWPESFWLAMFGAGALLAAVVCLGLGLCSYRSTPRGKGLMVRAALALALGCVLLKCTFWPGSAFDATLWHDVPSVDQGVRLAMADRLVATNALVGMTRIEVVEKLGPPDIEPEFADWDLAYYIGPERGIICLGSEYLLLRLSANGTVRECRIMSTG